ncbi:MAG: HAMP domain-containing histidine kinase [Chloroflexi bacterium]|nr:HAMP domain-containing histidine kinase [Chloroflexota bacterium]
MIKSIRSKFGWKIFLSYMVVILAGILVLGASIELALPTAFEHHMANLNMMTGGQMMGDMMSGQPVELETDLFASFRSTMNQAFFKAGSAAFITALIVSVLVSYRVVSPVREMMLASRDIARGNFQERVYVSGDPERADELTQLAISFNRMAEQLDQNEMVRQRLIGDISHELRTPLTVIKGTLEGLMDHVLPESPETYQQMHLEADRISHLVDDLQLLSQVEAGEYTLEEELIEVKDLIDTVVERLGQQYIDKDVELISDYPMDLPEISVDPRRMGQVMLNVVGNALQYSSPGDKVKITAGQINNDIQISVVDTGIGIPIEHQPYLFTRFYRVDRSRARASGGSGIGLTIARYLVEAHGGRIWVESAGEGQGSTFIISLPLTN